MKYMNTMMMKFRVTEISKTISTYFLYYWGISVTFSNE